MEKIATITINNSNNFAKEHYAEQINNVKKWGENQPEFNEGHTYNYKDKAVSIIDEFLAGERVAGVGQGRFTNKTKEYIKKNWGKITGKIIELRTGAGDKIIENCVTLQNTIIDCCKDSKAKSTPWASIHAMIAVLKPETFCTIVSENNIDQLYKLLKELKDITPEENDKQENNNTNNNEEKNTGGNGGDTKKSNEEPAGKISTDGSSCKLTINFSSEAWEAVENAWKEAKNTETSWYIKSIAIHRFFKAIEKDYYITCNYPWETLVALRGEERIKVLAEKLKLQKNLILTGAPGTGKTYRAKKIAESIIKDNKSQSEQVEFVQFHPSYDYTDFVEGLRPTKDNNGNVTFELKPGIFKKFCEKALEDWKETEDEEAAPKYVFIIDEINRGEISKIFGELFFSVDHGYRGKSGAVQTQYSNMITVPNTFDGYLNNGKTGQFFIPKNVYIIGTMNDIDRSVESMDFAFRRRFAFVEIEANESENALYTSEEEIIKNNADKLAERMQKLNKAIKDNGFTSHYQIGVAYFLKYKDAKNYTTLWNDYIKGTLYEYLRGEPQSEIDRKMKNFEEAYSCAEETGQESN